MMVEFDKCTGGPFGNFYVYKHDNHIAKCFRQHGWYEIQIIERSLGYIRRGNIVVDAGANMGTHTIPYAKKIGSKGKLYAFEIQEPMVDILNMNIKLHNLENVTVFMKALGHTNGAEVEIHKIGTDNKIVKYGNPSNYGAVRLGEGENKVEMMTLDSLNLERLDFIKADIEGSEPLFFYGAKETIKRCRPVILFGNRKDSIIKEVRKNVDIPDEVANFDIEGYCMKELGYHSCRKAPIKTDKFLIP